MSSALSEPAKLLLLTALLANDGIVSKNGICFIKELILRRDPRLTPLLKTFESKDTGDNTFVEQIHDLISEESQIVYDELFEDTSLEVGKTLSKDERERKKLNQEKSLIYGEVEYASFYRILRKINPEPGLIFYDLGSGTGKAVFVARLTQDFKKCIGIEILEGLNQEGETIVRKYNEDFKQLLFNGQKNYANVYQGSFLDFDWSDGDVVFANSTCFDDDLMSGLSLAAESLKPGAIVVTFTKGMTSRKFEVLEKKRYKMSWGPATVFIHRRLNANGTPVGPSRLNILPSDNVNYDGEPDDGAHYNGSSGNYGNMRGSDSEDNDDDDDGDDDNNGEYEDDGIDEGDEEDDDNDDEDDEDEEESSVEGSDQNDDEEDEDEDVEQQERREKGYKQYNHEENKYDSQEDEEEEEEEEEDDDSMEDLDIDEYIKNITREMKQHSETTAANAAYAYASAVNAPKSHYHESSPSRDPAYDEEESATGSEESASEQEDSEEEDDDDEQEVRDEMEEQIKLISQRIAHNKSLINTYTNMANEYAKSPRHEEDSDEDSSSGSELQPVSKSSKSSSSPAKVIPINVVNSNGSGTNGSAHKASPQRFSPQKSSTTNTPSHYPPTPPSANTLRAAAAMSSNGSGTKTTTANPYASPARSTTSSQQSPSTYTSPSKSSNAGSGSASGRGSGKVSKDPSPYANAPPKVYANSESAKKLFVSSPTRDDRDTLTAAEAFQQITSPQDEKLLMRKRMGNLQSRKLHASSDSD